MVRAVCLAAALVAGCGRIGFSPIADATPSGQSDSGLGSGSDARHDGGADAGRAAWRLVQALGAGALSGKASLTLPLAPTTAGDLVVVAVHVQGGTTVTSLTDDAPSGSSTYAAIAGSHATDTANNDDLQLWYAPAAAGGATTLSLSTNGKAYTLVAWELATARPATLDTAAVRDDQPKTTTPTSPLITTANPDELVIAVAIDSNNVTGLGAGSSFTNDTLTNDNGFAHLTDPFAPAGTYQATWTSSLGTYCADAAAFVVGP